MAAPPGATLRDDVIVKMIVCVLVQVGDARDLCVGPEFFQVVALALLGKKDVCKNRAIVYHYPLRVLVAVVVERLLAGFLLHIFSHAVGNRLHLYLGVAGSNHKTGGCGILELAQVDVNDVTSLLFLNSFNNSLNQFGVFSHFLLDKTICAQS